MGELASALTDLDEWARGVLFPLAVVLVVALAGYVAKCVSNILGEFRSIAERVVRIEGALARAGLADPVPGDPRHGSA